MTLDKFFLALDIYRKLHPGRAQLICPQISVWMRKIGSGEAANEQEAARVLLGLKNALNAKSGSGRALQNEAKNLLEK
jgi:hypothetical protein